MTRFNKTSKSALSIVLAVIMLFSTIIVGNIGAIDAVADTNYYLVGVQNCFADVTGTTYNSAGWSTSDQTFPFVSSGTANQYYIDIYLTKGAQFKAVNGDWTTTNGVTTTYNLSEVNDNACYSGSAGAYRLNMEVQTGGGLWYWLSEIPTPAYYIAGRFKTSTSTLSWNQDNTSSAFQFVEDSTQSGVYKFETGLSPYALSQNIDNNTPYFFIHGVNTNYSYYQPSSDTKLGTGTDETASGSSNALTLSGSNQRNTVLYFTSNNLNVGTTVLYFNPSTNAFWYTVEGATEYVVSAATGLSNGSISVNNSPAYQGDSVTVTATPDSGYVLDTVTVTDTSTGAVAATATINGNTATFTMPASNVTVSASFRAKRTYTITVASNNSSYGTVSPSTAMVTEGDSVTLTATPATDYGLASWTVQSGTGTLSSETNETTTFTPTGTTTAISILATFTAGTEEDVSRVYMIYGSSSEPHNFDKYKNLKKFTKTNGSVSYYVDFPANEIGTGNLYFALSNATSVTNNQSDVESKLINWSSVSVQLSESGDGTYINYETKSYNYGTAKKFGRFAVNSDYTDAVTNVRVYVDYNGSSFTTYTVKPTIDPTAATKSTVYAKAGTVRTDTNYHFQKYADRCTTVMTLADGSAISGIAEVNDTIDTSHVVYQYAKIPEGTEIKVTTTIPSDWANAYYVKGFCVNGVTYGSIEEPPVGDTRRTTGIYTLNYTIPDDTPYIEITPIYFFIENGGTYQDLGFITLHVEKYKGSIEEKWGNTISCQTWYTNGNEAAKVGNVTDYTKQNALGGFPGQPLVYEDGDYYMQVPKHLPGQTGTTVQGMTLSNFYWDDVHQLLAGRDMNFRGVKNEGASSNDNRNLNSQTYDFNDFAALAAMGADDIIFTFKYRSAVYNREEGTPTTLQVDYQANVWNGWDGLVDYYDRAVDVSGHILKDANNEPAYNEDDLELEYNTSLASSQPTKYTANSDLAPEKKIWIVSMGYEDIKGNDANGYYGNFGTTWAIYTYENGAFVHQGTLPGSSFIPPEGGYETIEVNGKQVLPTSAQDSAMYNRNMAKFLAFSTSAGTKTYRNNNFSNFVTLYNLTLGKPTMIAYEQAANKTTSYDNPALRCDGRWYYSTEESRNVTGHLLIEYEPLDKNGLTNLIDKTYLSEVSYSNGTGSATGATVKFTTPDNNDATKVWKNTSGVHATEAYSKTDYFGFNADSYSTKTENDTTKLYKLVGWYVKIGTNYTPINPTDIANVDGRYQKRVTNDFVARYKELDTSNVAVIDHQLLPGSTGDGKTYTTVQILSNGSVIKTYSKTDDPVQISGDDLTLGEQENYTFRITLTAEPNAYSSYADGTYDNTNRTALSGWEHTSGTQIWTKDFTASEITTLVGASKTKVFYSEFTLNTLSVTYKYYDRENPHNSEADINSTATSVTLKVPYTADDTISAIIFNGLNQKVGGGSMTNLKNILDEYYLWSTQASAVAGIKTLTNYRTNNNYSSNYTDEQLAYHCDNVGVPLASGEKWVNYTLVNGVQQPTTETDENNLKPNTQVTAVTVWAFNTPQKYNITFTYPDAAKYAANDTIANYSDKYADRICEGQNVNGTNVPIFGLNQKLSSAGAPNDGEPTTKQIYSLVFDDGVTDSVPYKDSDIAFYGQRIGTKVGNDSADKRNSAGKHIKNYGIVGYTGKHIIAQDQITREETVGETTETVTYTFDGWYDAKTGAKIGSTADYGYRVTSDLDLVAGYVKESVKTEQIGVSVLQNSEDYYFTNSTPNAENDTEATQHVRLNTELNVYDSPESNANITKTAVVYVQMRVQGAGSKYTTDHAEDIINQNGFIEALKADIKDNLLATGNNNTRMFEFGDKKVAYEVSFVYGTGTEDGELKLTNKNRADYILDLNMDQVETNAPKSALLAFAAIYLNAGAGDTTGWVLSDNYIDYVDITKETKE